MITIDALVTDAVLDDAFAWLCQRRKAYPPSADIWSFRRHWRQEKVRLQGDLRAARYTFSMLERITRKNREDLDLWSARDAVVLKALAIVLGRAIPFSVHCTHLKGHGGSKGAIRAILQHLPAHRFVLKTDVRAYYAFINHHHLLAGLALWIADRHVMNLIGQYLKRRAECGGLIWEYGCGIPLGCPLSPIIGAFFLASLDERMARLNMCYVRYMDDIVVLTPTRWRLRHAVKVVNQELDALDLEKHPQKTFIGRIERGFDFLGYHVSPAGLTVARETMARFVRRVTQLYEGEPGESFDSARLGDYVSRWTRGVRAGVSVD
jgi:hypothetical protein